MIPNRNQAKDQASFGSFALLGEEDEVDLYRNKDTGFTAPQQKVPMSETATDFSYKAAGGGSDPITKPTTSSNPFYEDPDISYEKSSPVSKAAGKAESFSVTAAPVRPSSTSPGPASWYEVRYYTSYFEVETEQVYARLWNAVFPLHSLYYESDNHHPDLYGPFWVLATLVLATSVGSNLFELFKALLTNRNPPVVLPVSQISPVNIKVFGVAATTFYLYVGIVSTSVWLARKYLNLKSSIMSTICMYGYSLTPLIPAMLFCSVPSSIFVWVCLSIGFGISTLFLVQNIWRNEVFGTTDEDVSFESLDDSIPAADALSAAAGQGSVWYGSTADGDPFARSKGATLAIVAICLHGLLYLFVRFYFFF